VSRVRALNASDAVQSRPVDFDQVAARLLEISADKNTSAQAPSRPLLLERSPTPLISREEIAKRLETEAYNDLVNDAGRPLYPISLLEQVSKDPEEYREILRPWLEYPDANPPNWRVFSRQLNRWQDFRRWQQDNRGYHDDEGFPAFVEAEKRRYARDGVTGMRSELEFDEMLKLQWDDMQRFRQWQRHNIREVHGDGGFPEYVEAVKHRLAQHGSTRTFPLEEDPTRQDKLTTWIEYLNFEYWWYDRYTNSVKRQQQQYDEAWKKLVGSKVLRPFETEESNIESVFRRASEEERAEKAVESAKSALIWTQKARNEPRRSNLTRPEWLRRLAAAQSTLDTAKESLKSIKRRNDLITDFIRGTRNYQISKKNADRHNILLRWILEQVPLVEAEGSSDAGRGTKRRLRRDQDEVTRDRSPKKQKRNDQISPLSDGSVTSTAQTKEISKLGRRDDTGDERPSKRFRNDGQDSNSQHKISDGTDATSIGRSQRSGIPAARKQDGDNKAALKTSEVPNNCPPRSIDVPQSPAISQRLRRRARIAARQDPSRIAVAPSRAVKSSRQRSRRKIAQAPTPPSSTGSQDRQSRSLATKASKGRGTTGGDPLGMSKPKGISKRRRPQRQSGG
jgi:hypothetical protein